MNNKLHLFIFAFLPLFSIGQDLSQGLVVNDVTLHPMTDIAKPAYLGTITDPSFGTTIRRITNTATNEVIVPMYSTIQAWNSDESMMILYNQSTGDHELMNGMNYQFIRHLDDINPIDLEQIFWDFNDPDILYYPENGTYDFIKYTVSTESKQTLVNLAAVSSCSSQMTMGNDIQMMSWDSDAFTFRCSNDSAYIYRIATGSLSTFSMTDVDYTAPAVAPSGNRFYHDTQVYDNTGAHDLNLNQSSVEHSCVGKLQNGNDALFAIAFAQGPQGGCIGDIIAHDLTTGSCFPIISQSQGYDYPQSGTHISSLAHKNSEGGWIAASMIGYDKDGQELLDQELVIAKAEEGNIKVCRIGHHRSDKDEFGYWAEPHVVISPSGTRVLFGSDWSGAQDGLSVDSYVVELPAFTNSSSLNELNSKQTFKIFPNPANELVRSEFQNPEKHEMIVTIYNSNGEMIVSDVNSTEVFELNLKGYNPGIYFFNIVDFDGNSSGGKFVKM